MDDRTRRGSAEPEATVAGWPSHRRERGDHLEQETWAEHDAALEATLFGRRPMLELELRDGKLRVR